MTDCQFYFFSFTGILFFSGLFLTQMIFSVLRNGHSKTFSEIGSPHILSNNNIRNNLSFQKFILMRGHRALHDNNLSRICDSLLVLQIIFVSLLLLIPLVFFDLLVGTH
ncbi:MAG: hypothetical protein ACI9JM_000110 [Halioglobus sp.]|jgi:hypothetical protein